jgi:VanZ family protein
MTRFRLAKIALFWAALLFSYGAAIMPGQEAPSFQAGDKTDHMLAFLTLTLLARAAWPARRGWTAGLWLSAYGIWIELSQAMPFIGRDASVWDWIADSAAILVGLVVTLVLKRVAPRLFED